MLFRSVSQSRYYYEEVRERIFWNGGDDVFMAAKKFTKDGMFVMPPNAKDNTSEHNAISEAYHKAKADGSNPELVKAVEDLLGKPKTQTSEQPTKPVTKPIPEVTETTQQQGIKEAVPEGTTKTGRTEPEGTAAVLEGGKGINEPPKPPTGEFKTVEDIGGQDLSGIRKALVSQSRYRYFVWVSWRVNRYCCTSWVRECCLYTQQKEYCNRRGG